MCRINESPFDEPSTNEEKHKRYQTLLSLQTEATRKRINAERGLEALQDVIKDYDNVIADVEREMKALLSDETTA
jgi:hypothetical protein